MRQQTVLACCSDEVSAVSQTPMDKKAASRIQSTYARANGGGIPKGSFPARAQRAADKRQRASKDADHSPNSRDSGPSDNLIDAVLATGVVAITGIGLYWWFARRQQRQQEAEARAKKVCFVICLAVLLLAIAVLAVFKRPYNTAPSQELI